MSRIGPSAPAAAMPVDHRSQPRDGCREVAVGVEAGGGEVPLGELPRPDRRAVGRGPAVQRAERVELGAVAAPVDERIEPETGEQLRELRGMAERVGHVADGRRPVRARRRPRGRGAGCERASRPPAAASRAARTTDPPRADRACEAGDELGAALGPDLEVVLEHDGLTVEHEPEPGIGVDEVEYRVDRVDEPAAEDLERSVPLPVPVEVGDEQDLARQTETT